MIASCISTGREAHWREGDEDERIMMGKDGGDEGGGGRSNSGIDEEDLYMYVRSFVGKNRVGDRLTRGARDGRNGWGLPKFHGKVPFSEG